MATAPFGITHPWMEEAFRETRYHWQSPLAASDCIIFAPVDPTPKNCFPCRAGGTPCTLLAIYFAALLREGRQVFLDGVFVGGSCDPLADGAKSYSSASVKGQPWRIQPKAEGAGAFVPPFLVFKNLGKLEFRMSLGCGNLHCP